MVMSAMQQQPPVIYGPNGQTARLVNGQYIVDAPSAAPISPQSGIPGMIPMETPASRRADAQLDLSGQREERMARAAELSARQAEITASRLAPSEEEQLKLARDAARNAQAVLPDLERFGRMNQVQGSGGLMAIPFADRVVGAFDPEAAQMNEITARMAPAQREPGSGNTSDTDLMLYLQASPSIQKPGQANVALIDRGRAEGRRRVAYADFLDRYARENQTLKGADEAFRAAVDAGTLDLSGNELRIRDLQPGETAETLAARGMTRGADGIWRFPRDEQGNPIIPDAMPGAGGSPPAGPSGGGGDNGGLLPVEQRGRRNGSPFLGSQGAFERSALEQVPFGDELMAGFAGVMSGQGYDRMRAAQQALAQYDRENNPISRRMGGIGGAVAQLPIGGPVLRGVNIGRAAVNAPRAERVGRFAARTAQNAGIGAAGAGVYAAGAADGGASERVAAGGNALGLGAVVGAGLPAVPPVARFADDLLGNIPSRFATGATEFAMRQGGRFGNALGIPGSQEIVERATPNALNPMVDRLAERLGPKRVNTLAARAQNRRDLGINPALIDVMDDGGVGLVRAASSRQGTGRQAVIDFYNARRGDLPAQTARIAREEISADTRPALDIIDAQRDIRRANASAIDTFGNDPVVLSPDVSAALQSPLARQAFRDAADRADTSIDPLERAAAPRLRALAEGRTGARELTVREAQDISKALGDTASAGYGRDASAPALATLARSVRQVARDNSEGYRAWLRQYGEDSDLMEAATRGRNFVSVSQDPINVRGTESFVRGANEAGDAEMAIQRAVSREAVEAAASNPRTARNILDAFANDTGMARRVEALGVDPERLRNRAQAVMESVDTAYRANPRGGSNSILNAGDVDALAGVSEAAQNLRSVARDPFFGGLQVIADSYTRRGFNNAEAEQLARLSVDLTRTDELIGLLSERMTRREARRLARSTRRQALATTQSGQQSAE
jgi:hypothetical protein